MALATVAAFALILATLGGGRTAMAADTATTTVPAGGVITETVTEPARTVTVSAPTTTVTNHTTTVQVSATPTTSSEESSSSTPPAWGWVLIGAVAVLFGLVMFLLGHHRSGEASQPPPRQGPPGPGTPT